MDSKQPGRRVSEHLHIGGNTVATKMAKEELAARQGSVDAIADANLEKMGYKGELARNLSMLSVLGLSFAIM